MGHSHILNGVIQDPSILMVCSGTNHARMMLPVARELSTRGWRVEFLCFDAHYDHTCHKFLCTKEFHSQVLPCPTHVDSWWKLTEEEISGILLQARGDIEDILVQMLPNVVLLGNDIGQLEQLVVRTAESLGTVTVRLQDGLQVVTSMAEATGPWLAELFEGGVDTQCVWSPTIRNQLLERIGTPRIVVTGNPRYDHLPWRSRQRESGGVLQVMLATQCFARYQLMTPAQEIAIYERIVRQLLQRPDVHVRLKLHPHADNRGMYLEFADIFDGRVSIESEEDSLLALRDIDFVVTISSTLSTEAALMGIPSARLKHLLNSEGDLFVKAEESYLSQLYSEAFPAQVNIPKLDLNFLHGAYCIRPDGRFTQRVTNVIETTLRNHYEQRTFSGSPDVSVILEFSEVDPLSAVNSMLRPIVYDGKTIEILAVDRSRGGLFAKALAQVVRDKRLFISHAPGVTSDAAFEAALQNARGTFGIRVDVESVGLPGAVQQLTVALEQNPEADVAISACAFRDFDGILHSVHPLPESPRLAEILNLNIGGMVVKNFAFRIEQVRQQLKQPAAQKNDGAVFLEPFIRNPEEPRRIAVQKRPAFLSTLQPRSITAKLLQRITNGEKGVQNSVPPEIEVSVLLCSYNRAEKVGRCLDALKNQTLPREKFEVICVNDGSTDQTGEQMKQGLIGLQGKYLEHEQNRALAAARNTAIRSARGRLLLFINDDTYAEPDFLEQHVKTHSERAGEKIAVHGFLPFIEEQRERVLHLALMENDLYFGFNMLTEGKPFPFYFFITGNLSVPRAAFMENDIWFDESFLRYGYEDIECGYRLHKLGYRVYYNPRARALHDHIMKIRDYRRREADNAANILQFVLKHPDPKLAQVLMDTHALTPDVVEQWRGFVQKTEQQVEDLTLQIESVEASIPRKNSAADIENTVQLIKEVGTAVRLIGQHVKYKSFLETLAQHPEIELALRHPNWAEALHLAGRADSCMPKAECREPSSRI